MNVRGRWTRRLSNSLPIWLSFSIGTIGALIIAAATMLAVDRFFSPPDVATRIGYYQLALGFVALWLAAILGPLAVNEFRRSLEGPDLTLGIWDARDRKIYSQRSVNQGSVYIGILNNGPVAATWFQVEFHPSFISSLTQLTSGFRRIAAIDNSNWRTSDLGNGDYFFTFLSNSQVAAHPGYALLLCEIPIPDDCSGDYECRYIIARDRGLPQEGAIRITVVRNPVSNTPGDQSVAQLASAR